MNVCSINTASTIHGLHQQRPMLMDFLSGEACLYNCINQFTMYKHFYKQVILNSQMVSFSLWGTFSKRYDTLLISPPETDISFRGGLNSELFNELFYLWQLRFSRVMQRCQDSVSYSDMCKANSLCRGKPCCKPFLAEVTRFSPIWDTLCPTKRTSDSIWNPLSPQGGGINQYPTSFLIPYYRLLFIADCIK